MSRSLLTAVKSSLIPSSDVRLQERIPPSSGPAPKNLRPSSSKPSEVLVVSPGSNMQIRDQGQRHSMSHSPSRTTEARPASLGPDVKTRDKGQQHSMSRSPSYPKPRNVIPDVKPSNKVPAPYAPERQTLAQSSQSEPRAGNQGMDLFFTAPIDKLANTVHPTRAESTEARRPRGSPDERDEPAGEHNSRDDRASSDLHRRAELDAITIQSLTTRLKDAEQDRAELRNALPQLDNFDQADIVREFDLLETSMKEWCYKVSAFAWTHCETATPARTPGKPLPFRLLTVGADYVPLSSTVHRWKSSGQFDQLVYNNLRSIVVQHVLDHIFNPLHPSLHRSLSRLSPNANIQQDDLANELLRDVADRIQQTSAYT
jgi:hypothetical protein